MFRFNNHHQTAYCCALLKLQLLKKLVKNVVMNQFGRVAAATILIIVSLAKHNNTLPDDGC